MSSYASRLADPKLFVPKETLHCACKHKCIPCLYKLAPEGLLQAEGNSSDSYVPANVRPELCVRLRSKQSGQDRVGLYDCQQHILLLGDGDFSFALALCNGLDKTSSSSSSSSSSSKRGVVYATSHESYASLLATYPNIKSTLKELQNKKYVTLVHGVDATNLKETAADSVHVFHNKFDRVIWNFPCIRAPAGFDGQVDNLIENKSLLRGFFSNISTYLSSNGEVHVTHKTLEPFQWWDIVGLAEGEGLHHSESIVFDKVGYPGYTNRKVLDKKSFPAHDAVTYVFTLSGSEQSGGHGEGAGGLVRYSDIQEEVQGLLQHYRRCHKGAQEEGGGKKRKRVAS